MRTKTETRRQAILQAATEVFQQSGFERSSMSDICERVGYSKPTLYSYFPSKEELFFAVMFEATEIEFQTIFETLDTGMDDITKSLENFGVGLLTLLYSPQVQAVRRLVSSEAGRSDLGKKCFELGPARSEAAITAFIQAAMDQGQLRKANPRVAGLHLKGLLEAEWIEGFIFQTLQELPKKELLLTVKRAVAVFMAAYGKD
ncbi:TetR/AcrR family transcriptional regulator [Limnohabitans sp. INBF002]|jgi:AcrR family transcriptional regulator|uniref:TetR/AcrR family transcriptional regulator n=1 Tax=Limnohabitans sp. INBF002 TaxID=2986280 RepID=UPI002377D03D|nr:TetR/AcrR family transcriptional regulator [Limnohabitans sp. INBF002]BDU53675.1 TetR family transcriptional regulator [Limnohabitans sp. INBF002]